MSLLKRSRDSSEPSASPRSQRVRSDSPRVSKRTRYTSDDEKENRVEYKQNNGKSENIKFDSFGLLSPLLAEESTYTSPKRPLSFDKTKPRACQYICIPRPLWDLDGENWRRWSDGKAERLNEKEIQQQLQSENHHTKGGRGILGASPCDNQYHKWIMMRHAWEFVDESCHLTGEETLGDKCEDAILHLNAIFKKKSQGASEPWITISSLGMTLNELGVSKLVDQSDAEKTSALVDLIGCAFLAVLTIIDSEGELHSTSSFLDLTLVIGYYLEIFHDLSAYGLDTSRYTTGAIDMFKKGELDPQKGCFGTADHISEHEKAQTNLVVDSEDETDDEGDFRHVNHKSENTLDWLDKMKIYKRKYGDRIALRKYNTSTEKIDTEKQVNKGKVALADVSAGSKRRN